MEACYEVTQALREKAFRAWPAKPVDLNARKVADAYAEDLVMSSMTLQVRRGLT